MEGLMPRRTRLQGCRRYDYMEVIGRVESGTEAENEAGSQSRGCPRTALAMDGFMLRNTWMCESSALTLIT
jgi:hypothetical protein